MNAYEIYTYGGGELLAEVLNAIATTVGDSSFKRLLNLSLIFSAAWFTFACILRRNPFHISKWLAGYYLVFQILLAPGVTVHIIERTGGSNTVSASQPVAHVPLGLAIFAHLTSSIGDGLTQLLEKHFSLPDDLSYSQTGTVMGSRLISSASHFYITDSVLNNNLERFFGQCVFYDILLQKYTVNELASQTDLWSFVKEHASPARGFVYSIPNAPSQIVTCKEGAQKMDRLWQQAIHQSSLLYGTRLFPRLSSEAARNQLLSLLPLSYGYLTHLTEDAAHLMQQNLLLNALETGLMRQGARTNSTAAIESYAFHKAQQQKRSTYRTLGEMAVYWLPLMKQVFEALMYGSFCIVVLLVMFPFGATVLRNYFTSLLWVQLWAPLYAILNLMVTLYASHKSLAAITLESGSGLTLLTHSGLLQANQDMSALAGYLSLSIPFISMGIVKGMASTMTQLAQYVGGVTQSIGSSTVNEATTGNIGLGNLQMNNQSAFNQSSYHVDNSARINTGTFGYQLAGGGTATLQGSGETVIDNSAAFSNLGVSINWVSQLKNNFSQQRDHARTAAVQEQEAVTKLATSGLRQLFEFGQHINHNEGTSDQYHKNDTYGLSDTFNDIENIVKNHAKDEGISIDQARRNLIAGYADAHIGGSVGVGTKISPVNFSGEIAGTAGVKIEHASMNESVDKHHFSNSDQYSKQNNFNHLVDKALKIAHDQTYRTGEEKTKNMIKNINHTFEEAETHRKESQRHYQEADSYHQSVQYLEENGASININANQDFSRWAQEQSIPGDPNKKMGVHAAEIMKDPAAATFYVEKYIEDNHIVEKIKQQAEYKGLGSSKEIYKNYQEMRPNYQPENLEQVRKSQIEEVKSNAELQGMQPDFNKPINQQIKNDYQITKNSIETKLVDEQKIIDKDKKNLIHDMQEKTTEKTEKKKD